MSSAAASLVVIAISTLRVFGPPLAKFTEPRRCGRDTGSSANVAFSHARPTAVSPLCPNWTTRPPLTLSVGPTR